MERFIQHCRNGASLLVLAFSFYAGGPTAEALCAGFLTNSQSGDAHSSAPSNTRDSKLLDLIDRLGENDPYERQRAAIALGNLVDPRAVEALTEALEDENEFVRNFAARSLGDLNDLNAVEPLIRVMKDENLLVRRSAAEALGNLGSPKAVDPLIEAMQNGHDLMRRAAIKALGRIEDSRRIEFLIEALRDEDLYIRNGAASALSGIGKPALPELVAALCDWESGPGILELLKDFEWQPSTAGERIWVDVAERNRKSLLENWDTVKKILIETMERGNDRQVQNAVFALIGIGQAETVEELVKIIEEKGTVTIAKAFINCGNDALFEAGHNWAVRNGAEIDADSQNPIVEWGAMETS